LQGSHYKKDLGTKCENKKKGIFSLGRGEGGQKPIVGKIGILPIVALEEAFE